MQILGLTFILSYVLELSAVNVEEKVVVIHRGRWIKEHDRDIRLARTQTSAVSELSHETGYYSIWNEVRFIDGDPHWYTRRVKEAIHLRLHPNNINRDSGIEIPEAWMSTIKNKQTNKTQQQENGTTADH